MRSSSLFFFFFLLVFDVHSQETFAVQTQTAIVEADEILSRYLRGVYSELPSNVDGNPFLQDEFKNGVVFFKDKTLAAQLKYHVAHEKILVLVKEQEYVLQDALEVEIEGQRYRKLEYERDDKQYLGYFQVLIDSGQSLVLLKKVLKKVRPGQAAGAMRPATAPRYVDQSDFYIQFTNSKPVMVEKRTKKFVKLFPEEHQDEVKDYMKENDLKSRDEQDLRNIVNFYNRIF